MLPESTFIVFVQLRPQHGFWGRSFQVPVVTQETENCLEERAYKHLPVQCYAPQAFEG